MKYHHDSVTGPAPHCGLQRYERWNWLQDVLRRFPRRNNRVRDIAPVLIATIGASGRLYPSQETLARLAGCAVRTVERAIAAMRRAGLLRVVHRIENGEQTSNGYVLIRPDESPELSDNRDDSFIVERSSPDSLPAEVVGASEQRAAAAIQAAPKGRWFRQLGGGRAGGVAAPWRLAARTLAPSTA